MNGLGARFHRVKGEPCWNGKPISKTAWYDSDGIEVCGGKTNALGYLRAATATRDELKEALRVALEATLVPNNHEG